MRKLNKLTKKIIRGKSNASISFSELCLLLHSLGFEERVRGSHHLFRKKGIQKKLNLQKEGSKAKPYQARQVRSIIIEFSLLEDI